MSVCVCVCNCALWPLHLLLDRCVCAGEATTVEPPTANIVQLFRDPHRDVHPRTASSVSWHPDGGKIAVSFSVLDFQKVRRCFVLTFFL